MMLQGIEPKLKVIDVAGLHKIGNNDSHLFMIRVNTIEGTKGDSKEENSEKQEPVEITGVLEEYRTVFDEPKGLPPSRGIFDHHIPLQEGSKAVNIRPCRHSPYKKMLLKRWSENFWIMGWYNLVVALLHHR